MFIYINEMYMIEKLSVISIVPFGIYLHFQKYIKSSRPTYLMSVDLRLNSEFQSGQHLINPTVVFVFD